MGTDILFAANAGVPSQHMSQLLQGCLDARDSVVYCIEHLPVTQHDANQRCQVGTVPAAFHVGLT